MPHTCSLVDNISLEQCGKKFATISELEKHVKKVHGRTRSTRQKKFQTRVRNRLQEEDLMFTEELHVPAGCVDGSSQRYFVDFWLPTSTYDVMLEVDEGQHRFGYGQCQEVDRMMDICATYTSRCLWILRYSPSTSVRQVDSKGKEVSKSDRLTQQTRLDALVNKLRNPPDVVVRGDVRLFVTYMFYDWYLDEGW